MAIDESLAADFAAMGVMVEGGQCRTTEDDFEVWPENWDSIMAWVACETQWRALTGLCGLFWLGLDYPAVDVVLRRREAPAIVFNDLQHMERAALAVLNEVHDG